jgi:serine/threonine-protein kinase
MLHCPTCGAEYSADLTRCPKDDTLLQADATVASNTADDHLLGRTLDEKYLLEERLGVGGMGTVYRARHLLIDRAVAVKVLNQRLVEDEAAKTRFRREAKAAGRLQHANAVGVTDFGETSDGHVYIVMELLEGKTLREVLAKEAPLEVARAVSMMLQVSSAVAAAHEAGIIHRDLKPANIFIVQRPDAPAALKVLDFGIAKLAADSLDDDDRQTLTQVGAIIGTPRYMSPEQCNGKELTPASDVYSLGVILYEMLTGTVPFSGSSALAIALKHTTESPRRLSEFVSSIPVALEDVVLHALEKKPEERPPDAGAFRRELYETTERLGLEHAAAASGPSMEALRSAGTESPSGRLVVDLGRLRENRAATSSSGELTKISETESAGILNTTSSAQITVNQPAPPGTGGFSRLSVAMNRDQQRTWQRKSPLLAVAVVAVILMLVGAAFRAFRSRGTAPAANVSAVASPTPAKVEPSPSPSPAASPTASPKKEDKKQEAKKQTNKNEKKESTGRKILNTVQGVFGIKKKKPQ